MQNAIKVVQCEFTKECTGASRIQLKHSDQFDLSMGAAACNRLQFVRMSFVGNPKPSRWSESRCSVSLYLTFLIFGFSEKTQ